MGGWWVVDSMIMLYVMPGGFERLRLLPELDARDGRMLGRGFDDCIVCDAPWL